MTQRVDELFHARHGVDPGALSALDAADLFSLAEIASGATASADRARAIAVWAQADPFQGVLGVSSILTDPLEDPSLRAVAAASLTRAIGGDAIGALAALLEGPADAALQVEALLQIAKVGTPEVLPAIDALIDVTSDPEVADQARFSTSVIAYRHGIAGRELPTPEPADILFPEFGAPAITTGPADAVEVEAISGLGPVETYGVVPGLAHCSGLDCNGQRLVVALDPTLADDQLFATASSRPLLLGVVAGQAPDDGSYAVDWLLLSWPQPLGAFIAIYRPTGRRIAFGLGGSFGAFSFSLQAVRGPGASGINVFGSVSGAGIAFDGAFSSAQIAEPKLVPDAE